MRLILLKYLFIVCLGLSLQGCSSLKDLFSGESGSSKDKDEYVDWSADKFRTELKLQWIAVVMRKPQKFMRL